MPILTYAGVCFAGRRGVLFVRAVTVSVIWGQILVCSIVPNKGKGLNRSWSETACIYGVPDKV